MATNEMKGERPTGGFVDNRGGGRGGRGSPPSRRGRSRSRSRSRSRRDRSRDRGDHRWNSAQLHELLIYGFFPGGRGEEEGIMEGREDGVPPRGGGALLQGEGAPPQGGERRGEGVERGGMIGEMAGR